MTENLLTKFVSVLIAAILWVVVLGSRNVEVTKEVPLELVTSPDIVVANDVPERVSFRLSGPKAFLRAILDRRDEPIRINLLGAKPGIVNYRFFSDLIRVPLGVKVLNVAPLAASIRLEMVKRREVPVRLEFKGDPLDGFHLTRVEPERIFVKIKGAESRIDRIAELTASPIDLTGLHNDLEREVPLDLSTTGVTMDGPLPRVLLRVDATSANYRIKNVDVKVLSGLKVTLEERSVTVLVRASADDLKNLDRSTVYGVVDLRGKPAGKYRSSVKVIHPDSLGVVRVIPDEVTVRLD